MSSQAQKEGRSHGDTGRNDYLKSEESDLKQTALKSFEGNFPDLGLGFCNMKSRFLFKPPSLWSLVTASLTNQYGLLEGKELLMWNL